MAARCRRRYVRSSGQRRVGRYRERVAKVPGDETSGRAGGVVGEHVTVVRGGRVALRDASFELRPGGVTAVIGPNGSGKTTLLHAVAGLVRPFEGRIRVDGPVAYVLQSAEVAEHLPISVREVVTMGRYAVRGAFRPMRPVDHAAVDAAMERLEVADLASRQIRDLSGGQRQRALVAQGLVQEAPVLLLDEPVTGLDVVSHRLILDVIAEQRAAGVAVVVTTHDLGEAAHADQVLLLSGRLVAAGPPEEVLVGEHLADAYGQRLVQIGDNVLMLDDAPHHAPDAGDVHPHPGHHH